MEWLPDGIYERLIDRETAEFLDEHPELRTVVTRLETEESSPRLSSFLAGVIRSALLAASDSVAEFDSYYWNSTEFLEFTAGAFRKVLRLAAKRRESPAQVFFADLRPRPFHERILERLDIERVRA